MLVDDTIEWLPVAEMTKAELDAQLESLRESYALYEVGRRWRLIDRIHEILDEKLARIG